MQALHGTSPVFVRVGTTPWCAAGAPKRFTRTVQRTALEAAQVHDLKATARQERGHCAT